MAPSSENAVKIYLERMQQIRSTGSATSETSYYSALENLLNEIGRGLDPDVICNGQLKNQGAGHPDFGLYSKKQCSKGAPKPGQGEVPERGVVEVKPLADKTWQTAKGKQATKYFGHYRLVLVTNYREFRLIGEDDTGKPIEREFFRLADDEMAFWGLAAHPEKAAKEHGPKFAEFLKRVMMNAAPLLRAEDIAWFLASYARDALIELENKDASALAPLRSALEAALGIKFEGAKGEHFFRSTLVQTLFYGVFSAWVIWAHGGKTDQFNWRHAAYILTVPMIRSLFEEVAKPTRLKPLGLMHILDRTGEALNRVDQATFFKTFDTGQAVQHFYEPFLEAFDPTLRKEMGVWYTPPEIVRYMVSRVDSALRSELGIADGLANKNVYVLDPCCGTGAFVVEVLRKIEETLRAKGDDPLIGEDIKEAARDRIFGFEIMSAPFVIAHWQVGNLLANLGAPLDPTKGERPSVFLTNALTGWEPPKDPKASLPLFPELEQERDQAEHVKRDVPILVVLGNPPYNAYAGTSPDEEEGLVDPYKDGLISRWGIKKFNLDELYVRFLRVAERRIAKSGRGIVCYVSSYSYLSDPSFVVAREHLLRDFDQIWIDSLNGDSRETGKRTPTGDPDPSIFSTPYNRAGIRLGTAVGMFVRRETRSAQAEVLFRNFWGTGKREALLASLSVTPFRNQYEIADPKEWNKFTLKYLKVDATYLSWPKLIDIGLNVYNGPIERRGMSLVRFSDERLLLEEALKKYLDPAVSDIEIELVESRFMLSSGEFDAVRTRKALAGSVQYSEKALVKYPYKPFDVRLAYLDNDIAPLFSRPAPDLLNCRIKDNWFFITRDTADKSSEGAPYYASRFVSDYDAISGHARHFPIFCDAANNTDASAAQGKLALPAPSKKANLSSRSRHYLSSLAFKNLDADKAAAEAIWLHALAIGYSPKYLTDNAGGISIDWPRIPLPKERGFFEKSVLLGSKVQKLLDGDEEIPGVTSGTLSNHMRIFGTVFSTDLTINAGWGRKDSQGKVFPGRGKIEVRDWTDAEKSEIVAGLNEIGLDEARGFKLLGRAVDVYLNDTNFWRAVPEAVWEYYIGGCQVIKKWLSYREEAVLGRSLKKEEVREVTGIVRRLAAIVLMTDSLDENYVTVRDNAYSWPSGS